MQNYLSKLLYILTASKKKLFVLLLAFTFVSVVEALGIGMIGPFINIATDPSIVSQNALLKWAYAQTGLTSIKQFIVFIGVGVIVTFCVKSYLSWRVQTYVFIFSYEQQHILSNKLLHAYLNAPYTFHLNKSSSHIIQNIVTETKSFSQQVLIPFLVSVSNAIITLSLAILLGITNFYTVAITLGTLLPVILILNTFKNKIARWGKDASDAGEAMIKVINHSLGGIKETKVIGCGSYFEKEIDKEGKKYVNAMGGFFAFKLLPRIVVETFLIVFLVGFTSIALLMNQDFNKMTAILSVFALSSIRLIPAISNLATGVSTLKNSSYTLKKLYTDLKELENIKPETLHSSEAFPVSRSTLKLNNIPLNKGFFFNKEAILENVSYRYSSNDEKALHNISLSLKKGQSIAFIGKSGSGKTTLVDVILGLLIPESGDIKVDGQSVYNDLRKWQNLIAYIPQTIFLIEDTIEKNIAFGVPENLIDQKRLNNAIKAAQLEELVERLPKGIQTMVGERGVLLSGGQRQRIGIARALYHEREILILDEATAALDNETEALVTQAMQSLSGLKTLIIIAHRLSTIEHCDCIYVLERGRVVKSGNYQEVVQSAH
ncbi:MAG: ABC transporter ATP-binding protein/permease [Scytonematopsis contorta HA4267-MV1]|jgi:ABC-type multidrug transport system fused ATPase/permease subunit|nr:ABC transporter ATP-binding protein/permease [Scytonematopsis contorta HA4267-MV1]